MPQAHNLPTRASRINVPGGKGSVILDNSTGVENGMSATDAFERFGIM